MKTNRLDNKKILELINSKKIDKIFIDIDYTVFDFDIGNKRGNKKLNDYYPKLGDEVGKIFDLILRGKRSLSNLTKEELIEYKKNIKEISDYQNKVVIEYGVKYWSRETMIMIASKKIGLTLKADDILKLRKIYWKAVSDVWEIYDDAIPFLNKIKKEKIKIIWVTGSDSILKIKQVGEKIELDYDPEYSSKEKRKRMEKLLKEYPGEFITGDPVDKPAIWNKLFKNINIKNTLVVGDSYETDLKQAEGLGIKTVLIKRD
ncbi:MAG: HAD family hydrolase [Candidatus Shapirobacteria bacterium]|jgi:FMN phosphatase YigB (HAD superfamily)